MGNIENHSYDLSILLRVSNLDLRRLARDNLSLDVREYYLSLSKYLSSAPLAIDSFNRIASNVPTYNRDYLNIINLKTLMEEIGCNKFSEIIDDMLSACKRGHTKYGSDLAISILDEVKVLHSGVMAAIKPVGEEATADAGRVQETVSLRDVLKLLEFEDSYRKKRILAIDDSAVMLKTISSVLNDDYEVYTLTNPMNIEKVLQQVTPDLFILDYKMPNRSGFDLVPIIRSFWEHKETPIIILTSLGTADHVSAAFAIGACDFIVKPFQGDTLLEKIGKHIDKKK